MHLPTSTITLFPTSTSTNTTAPIPEHGSCIVCNAISNDILLIQFFAILLLILIPPIANSSLAQKRGITVSDNTKTRYAVFSSFWVLGTIVHATIKWFRVPWATEPDGGPDPGIRKQFWVHIAVTMVSAVNIALVIVVCAVMGFLSNKLQNWLTRRFGINFRKKKDAEGNFDVGADVPVIMGEETPLWADEMDDFGSSPDIDVAAAHGSKPF